MLEIRELHNEWLQCGLNVQYQIVAFCNHALWLSSQEGKIMKYDQRTNRLKTFNASISDGPISAFVKENQNLWFACYWRHW